MPNAQRSTAIVTLSDGRAGNARQALALAEALARGAPVRHVLLQPRAPWRWPAPRRWPGARHAFGPGFSALLDGPDVLAIGCGRQAALATRLLHEHGSRAVQILDPRLDPRHWDVVVVPQHDARRGANVITLLGSLNPVDDAWLQRGRLALPALGALPSPRIALLVGGPSAQVPWREDDAATLFAGLAAQLRRGGGSVLATTSRRTPAGVRDALRQAFADIPGLRWCGDDDGPNPYAGLLGWADGIVATADSVNMLSEACATTAPVTAAFADVAHGRVRDFIRSLRDRQRLCDVDAVLRAPPQMPLRETRRVAGEIAALLQPGHERADQRIR